ncbi:hypothetical protein BaRGS_00038733, partial [Batillaria attramentaria]
GDRREGTPFTRHLNPLPPHPFLSFIAAGVITSEEIPSDDWRLDRGVQFAAASLGAPRRVIQPMDGVHGVVRAETPSLSTEARLIVFVGQDRLEIGLPLNTEPRNKARRPGKADDSITRRLTRLGPRSLPRAIVPRCSISRSPSKAAFL